MELRAFREALGLGIEEMAKEAGVSRITLWRFETGLHNPSAPTLAKLSRWAADKRRKHKLPARFHLDWERLTGFRDTGPSSARRTGKRKAH